MEEHLAGGGFACTGTKHGHAERGTSTSKSKKGKEERVLDEGKKLFANHAYLITGVERDGEDEENHQLLLRNAHNRKHPPEAPPGKRGGASAGDDEGEPKGGATVRHRMASCAEGAELLKVSLEELGRFFESVEMLKRAGGGGDG